MTLQFMERLRIHSFLGIRFWDPVTQQSVTEGLQVTAQRLRADRSQRLGQPVPGKVTPGGAIAFFGLTPAERPDDTVPDLWDGQPADQRVVVDVVDRRSQFLPLSFVAQFPLRGVFQGQGAWLSTALLRPEPAAGAALGVQLWSAPSRLVPPGRAMVRSQLVVGETMTPAAYALLRVQLAPPLPATALDYFALADHRGTVVIPMPYPRVPEPATASTPYPSLDQQTFPLRITAQYHPNPAMLPGSTVPNLEALLTQPPANIGVFWEAGPPRTLPPQPQLSVNLQFGQPLILRTALGPETNAAQESVLRILPTSA